MQSSVQMHLYLLHRRLPCLLRPRLLLRLLLLRLLLQDPPLLQHQLALGGHLPMQVSLYQLLHLLHLLLLLLHLTMRMCDAVFFCV